MRSRRSFRYGQTLLCALALMACFRPALAVPEYDLKAAFIYNFALFTEWPPATTYEGGTLNFCINPVSPLRPALQALGDKAVRGRRISVRTLTTVDAVRSCHVLVLDASDRQRWPALRAAAAGSTMLVVTDDAELGAEVGTIALGIEGGKVVFDVDTRLARQSQLVLSSRLLRLARSVQ